MTHSDIHLTKQASLFHREFPTFEPENSVEAVLLRVLAGVEGFLQRKKITYSIHREGRSWSTNDDQKVVADLSQFIADIYSLSSENVEWQFSISIETSSLMIDCSLFDPERNKATAHHYLGLPLRSNTSHCEPINGIEQISRWELSELARPFYSTDTIFQMLVIDASIEIIQFLKRIFTPYYHVIAARSAQELKKIAEQNFSIIVADPVLGDGQASDIIASLRAPKVIMSAETNNRKRFLDIGATVILDKPFCAVTLAKTVRNIVDSTTPPSLTKTKRSDWVHACMRIIAEHYADVTFNQTSLATQLYLSERTLLRRCNEYFGLSPRQLIELYRLQRAYASLQAGFSVTVSGLDSGYKYLESFSRAFKRRFGVTPEVVREKR